MTRYTAVVHKDTDTDYGIHIAGLPLFSSAASIDDVPMRAQAALRLFAETEPLPDLASLDIELDSAAFVVEVDI
ncbi:hypothetical protein PH7735_00356 [Shimia thalassica]|uniref:HicB-like antitoxin of toxin-antitoxin system domain-containing protein n=1 Tax=Shimia thalassica TaxID=1715693 RepID=A0A0P1I171_9RHOB|nr:hypothetical protein [Shimia thalassica]CUJ84256.1 hypothetical protein PH7735_00356 [Shimia thalassica]